MGNSGTSKRAGRRRVAGPRGVAEASVAYQMLGAPDRVARVVGVLGSNLTADLLGVSKSQPSRWRSGKERVSAESMQRLVELDYIVSRLLQLWAPGVIRLWMTGHHPHLGARPIDVLRLRGMRPVIDALDAEEAGAFA